MSFMFCLQKDLKVKDSEKFVFCNNDMEERGKQGRGRESILFSRRLSERFACRENVLGTGHSQGDGLKETSRHRCSRQIGLRLRARRSIRSGRTTGGTSTPSALGPATTRGNGWRSPCAMPMRSRRTSPSASPGLLAANCTMARSLGKTGFNGFRWFTAKSGSKIRS